MSKASDRLGITPTQEKNLRTIAAHLLALPSSYAHFDMESYARVGHNGPATPWAPAVKIDTNVCGSVACVVGHGPLAGIAPKRGEDWSDYAFRAFGADSDEHSDDDDLSLFDWLFGSEWARTDNSARGAAHRILWTLDNGRPRNTGAQRSGDANLCYLPQEA